MIINTHLQADYAKGVEEQNIEDQITQLRQIKDFIVESKYKKSILITGDLNVDGLCGSYVQPKDVIASSKRVQHCFDLV